MKLVASKTSPFARKIRIMLHEKNMLCEFVEDIPWNADTHVPDYNPLGKIPVLVMNDGSTWFDSRVIAEFLEIEKPWPSLLPEDEMERLHVRRWEALADGISDAAATIFLEKKRDAAQQSPDWIARQKLKIERGLQALDSSLGGRTWCVNDTFSLADITVACTLGYLDLRFPEIDWRKQYPALKAHAERASQRPSVQQTVPPAA